MKVLVVGKGGREHALVWKLAQSKRVERVYCAPGNAGTARDGVNVPVAQNDFDGLIRFAKREGIGFTVVGPEDPLAAGVVDAFQAAGLRVFGATFATDRAWDLRPQPSKSSKSSSGGSSAGDGDGGDGGGDGEEGGE